jgi:predicted regulator of Ras-like GTPase activity (Roadblock/LC7/MglB family)
MTSVNNSKQATISRTAAPGTGELGWLLDDLIQRLPGAEDAIVLSDDGLPLGRSAGLGGASAGHLAALASALSSVSRGVGMRVNKGRPRQTVVELDEGYLVVTEAGAGACLALLASAKADLGVVAYEMNVIAGQVGGALSADPQVAPLGGFLDSPAIMTRASVLSERW